MTQLVTRRDILKIGAASLTAAVLPQLTAANDTTDPYLGFRMGIQSYSLREFSAEKALEHTKALGLKYWESFRNHVPMTAVPKQIQDHKDLLGKYGVTLIGYGVVPFDEKENPARELFEFAKAMGIKSLSADPKPDKATFDLLDKLVAEYDVAVAIHNHGPGHRYNKIADVENVVKDRHPKIGACVDTGHYLRSDEDPVEAIQRLGKRVFGCHLKDVKTIEQDGKRQKQFKIAGEGDLNVVGLLKALKSINFDYCLALEYEENAKNPLPDIEACLKHVRECAAKV